MKKRKFISEVHDGKITTFVSSKIRDVLATFDGVEVLITIEKNVRKRSNKQNRYLWGCLYPCYIQAMLSVGDDSAVEFAKLNKYDNVIDAVHEMLLDRFAGQEYVNKETGEMTYVPIRSSQMSTIEFGLYFEAIIQHAQEDYDFTIPLPDSTLSEELANTNL